jgi:hypothetical protein
MASSTSARFFWSVGKSKIPPQLGQPCAEGAQIEGRDVEGHVGGEGKGRVGESSSVE